MGRAVEVYIIYEMIILLSITYIIVFHMNTILVVYEHSFYDISHRAIVGNFFSQHTLQIVIDNETHFL